MMYCFVPRTLQFEASNSVYVHNNNIIHYRVAEVEESANPFPLAGLVFPLGELLDATDQKDEKNLLGCGGYGSVYRGVLKAFFLSLSALSIRLEGPNIFNGVHLRYHIHSVKNNSLEVRLRASLPSSNSPVAASLTDTLISSRFLASSLLDFFLEAIAH